MNGNRREPPGGVGGAISAGPERLLAAAVHLNLAAPALAGLLALLSGNFEGALGIALFPALLWVAVDAAVWFGARRMASPVASHASQATWWGIFAFIALFIVLVAAGEAAVSSGVLALLVFGAPGALGAYRVLRGEPWRYPLVGALVEGRQ